MKATGIVRRIDDLGRVVIPKEIRLHLGIKEGDPLELYYDDKGVCFVPYLTEEGYTEKITHLISMLKEEDADLNNKNMVISALEIANELLRGDSKK